MTTQEIKNTNEIIDAMRELLEALPFGELIGIANTYQSKIVSGEIAITNKSKYEIVSPVDVAIQKRIEEYLRNSDLYRYFSIIGEEETGAQVETTQKPFTVLIDPLDGTSEYVKGGRRCGIMVGICDSNGVLIESVNCTIDGEIISQSKTQTTIIESFAEKKAQNKKISIDVYDYGAGSAEKYKTENPEYEITSYPSALWAGRELYNGNLDGMLWLPSMEGKKYYPDYDLIFLGALKKQGWKILLGTSSMVVEMVVVAPTEMDADFLWNTGISMLSKDKITEIRKMDELRISSKI